MINDAFNTYRDLVEMPDREEETTKEERERMAFITAAYGCATYVMALFAGLLICLLLGSCTTTEYVPIIEHRTEHNWHTDSVKQRDSVHTENTTVIREVDSAAMAQYGIQMQANQRAWLVLQREMENRLREMEHMTTQRDTIHDSIPYPITVVKEMPAELTWWQQTRIHIANILLWLLVMLAGLSLLRKAINNNH